MAEFIQKFTFTTELNADSVEWCPIQDYQHVFTCATYQLCNKDSAHSGGEGAERRGTLYLFRLSSREEEEDDGRPTVRELDKLPTPGILDCKWAHLRISGRIYLAIATALGEVRIYRLNELEEEVCLELVSSHRLESNAGIALSLDWSTGSGLSSHSQEVRLVVSDSGGCISVLSFDSTGGLVQESSFPRHSFEAWISAWNYSDPNIFYSGGDDCKLLTHDRRTDSVATNLKAHTAGVTSMHFNFKDGHTLISGSYDETIAFWDVRQMSVPTSRLETDGGVWRLKWEPRECQVIAAACMHGGFAGVDGGQPPAVLAGYKQHSSLAYGIDWCHLGMGELSEYLDIGRDYYSGKKVHVLAMCSFYDNLMSLAILLRD